MDKFFVIIITAIIFTKIGIAGFFKTVDSDIISETGTVKYVN